MSTVKKRKVYTAEFKDRYTAMILFRCGDDLGNRGVSTIDYFSRLLLGTAMAVLSKPALAAAFSGLAFNTAW